MITIYQCVFSALFSERLVFMLHMINKELDLFTPKQRVTLCLGYIWHSRHLVIEKKPASTAENLEGPLKTTLPRSVGDSPIAVSSSEGRFNLPKARERKVPSTIPVMFQMAHHCETAHLRCCH